MFQSARAKCQTATGQVLRSQAEALKFGVLLTMEFAV